MSSKDKVVQFKKKEPLEKSVRKGFNLYNEGKILFDKNNDEIAMKKFLAAEKLGYKSPELFNCIAWIYGKDDSNNEKVFEYIEKSLKCDENHGYTYYLKGVKLKNIEKYEESLKCFFKAEELEYIVSDLYTQISWCYECLGNFMNASAYASKAINLYPKEYNCYRRKAWVYYVQGQYEEALKYFFEAEKLGDIENYNSIAYCAYMLNNYDLALDYANKMIFQNNKDAYGYYRKGWIYYVSDKYDKALKTFLLAEKNSNPDIDKDIYDMYSRISWIYDHNSDFEKSMQYADKAIKLNPKDSYSFYRKACIYSYGHKNYSEALKYYKAAYKLDKSYPDMFFDIGNTYMHLKKYKLGIKYVNEGLELFPDDIGLIKLKIAILYLMKNNQEIRAVMKKIENKMPDDLWFQQCFGMFQAFGDSKNYKLAIEYLEPIKDKLETVNIFALFALAFSYVQEGYFEKGIEAFLEYSQKEDYSLLEYKDKKEIKRLIKTLGKMFPENSSVKEIKNNFRPIYKTNKA